MVKDVAQKEGAMLKVKGMSRPCIYECAIGPLRRNVTDVTSLDAEDVLVALPHACTHRTTLRRSPAYRFHCLLAVHLQPRPTEYPSDSLDPSPHPNFAIPPFQQDHRSTPPSTSSYRSMNLSDRIGSCVVILPCLVA
jgi:hypothetical protein